MLSTALGFLIDVVFGLFTYALLLRLVMQVMRAPFRNPARPVGDGADRLGREAAAQGDCPVSAASTGRRVVAAYVFQFAWLLALYFAFGRGFALLGPGLAFVAVAALIALVRALLWLTIIVVFAQAILSWVAPDGPLAGVLNALTFPLLRPVRRLVPPIGGTLDLSPLIVIVVAQLILITLVPWLEAGATRFFL